MTNATTDSDADPGAPMERLLALLLPPADAASVPFATLMGAIVAAMRDSPAPFEAILRELYREQYAFWQRWLLPSPGDEPGASANEPTARPDPPPFFAMVAEQHGIWNRWAAGMAKAMDGNDPQRQRVRFMLRQWSAATAPANFLATNAEAIAAASATHGATLARGLERARADTQVGRVTLSNGPDFAVGRSLATTGGAVVLETDVMQLIQYRPRQPRVASRPLVMVPPFINKYYILDLRPGRSLVEWALDQGQQVFMISWRNASAAMATSTWEDFVRKGVLAAVDAATAITGSDRANVLGYCVGGTLSVCAAGVDAAATSPAINSLTLLATLLDYTDPGEIGVYIDERSVRDTENRFGDGGVVPAATVANAFASLRPGELVWDPIVHHYLLGQTPPASDLLYWNDDGTDLPGPVYAWYLRHLYLMNRLCVPGGVRIGAVPIHLSKIAVPAYVLAARDDHIVPWASAFRSLAYLGGPCRFVLGENGHVGGIVNPAARERHGYWTQGEPARDAPAWLALAQHNRGSWWHDWNKWLAPRSGRLRAAPKRPGNQAHPPLEDAPGRFVLERAAAMPGNTA